MRSRWASTPSRRAACSAARRPAWSAGEQPLDLGPAVGANGLVADPLLDRVYAFLTSAIGQMSNGLPAKETLALAGLACEVGEHSSRAPLFRTLLTLIELGLDYVPPADEQRPRFTPGAHLIVFAAILARTPDAPLPDLGGGADVSERERGEFRPDPAG